MTNALSLSHTHTPGATEEMKLRAGSGPLAPSRGVAHFRKVLHTATLYRTFDRPLNFSEFSFSESTRAEPRGAAALALALSLALASTRGSWCDHDK